MAKLGVLTLDAIPAGLDSFVTFDLPQVAEKSSFLEFENAQIEVAKGQRDVVTRFPGATSAGEAFAKGLELTQRGLDMLSMLGRADLTIHEAEESHTLGWFEGTSRILRVTSTSTIRASVGNPTLIVTDAQGNVVPSTPMRPEHHPAFRFFRLAQVSDDLYDAFRNMYLAFELLLSSRFPKGPGEREIDWLKRGLTGASSTVLISDLVPQASTDSVAALLDLVYEDARLPLFHAKEGRDYYVPQSSPDQRKAVAKALAALTVAVVRMAETWFRARRMGGGWNLRLLHRSLADQFDASCCSALTPRRSKPTRGIRG
jgi:hypothetical protein